MTQSDPGPPAQDASQFATKAAMLRSNAFNSASFARTATLSTLIIMVTATVLLTVAVLWPLIEKPLIHALRA